MQHNQIPIKQINDHMSVLTDRLCKSLSYFPHEVNNNMYLIAITIHIYETRTLFKQHNN